MWIKVQRTISLLILFFLFSQGVSASREISFQSPDSLWADSVFNTLTLDEQIAQLIFVRANKDNIFLPEIPDLISRYNIGGVVFFKSTPVRQANKTNEYQALAKTPIMVCIDAERGLAMRLDSTTGFPYAMTVGATMDEELAGRMATQIGKDCKRMGIHMNFGPVVDINSNPANPVINMRSFGQDREKVLRLSRAYINGHKASNILYTAKHFPGHGDTDTDSHLTLPVLLHSRQVLDSIDLYPYKKLISEGLDGIMVAHLYIPALDTTSTKPSTLSKAIVSQLLQKDLGFNGLVVTDALEMGGVTKGFKPGEIEVHALLAGNDILLMPLDVPMAIMSICAASDTNSQLQQEIALHCKKVLRYKYKVGLANYSPIRTEGLIDDLNSLNHRKIAEEIMQKSATLIKNRNNLLPLTSMDTMRIASIVIGDTMPHIFQKQLAHYAPTQNFSFLTPPDSALLDSFLLQLSPYNLVLIAITNTSILSSRDYGINRKTASFVASLSKHKTVVLSLFGNPYAINRKPELNQANSVLITYQDNPLSWKTSAEIIFGARPVHGKIPVSISPEYPYDSGIHYDANNRLLWNTEEATSKSDSVLKEIESSILKGISDKAYPGCQVLYARNGSVLFQKAYGTHTYESTEPVRQSDLYDIASLTKIFATTLAIMKLVDERKILLDEPLSNYLPELKNTNKSRLIIRDIMCHQARLKPWIPFYKNILLNGQPDTTICKRTFFPNSIRVADSFFIPAAYKDSVFKEILDSPLEKDKKYLYSDLGFILLKEMIERMSNQPFEKYLNDHYYRPLGLKTTGFIPLERFFPESVIPTENDTVFRKQIIRGYVHDPAAAMLDGVAGHAGLFSNAEDLAVILQMLLNKGTYGGVRYIKEETVRNFTSVQFPWYDNRRGIGFDKPLLISSPNGPSCNAASPQSYGHSGFTGTYCWVDPLDQSVFIFLSNRVYPDAGNNKLSKSNLRTNLHELFYHLYKN